MKSSTKYLKIIINYILMLLLVLLCVFVLPKVIVFLMPFVVAWIISLIVNPLVKFLESKLKLKRKAGSVFVIILALGIVGVVFYMIIALIVTQISGLMSNMPNIVSAIEGALRSIEVIISRVTAKLPIALLGSADSFDKNINESLTMWMGSVGERAAEAAGDGFKNLPLAIIGIVMGVLASYSFVAERNNIVDFLNKIISESVKKRISLVTDTMKNAVGGYFKAQFKIMAVVYVVLFVGFLILGINYSFVIALLIALLDFLPFFGTGTVMWPWAVIALVQKDYKLGIGMLIVWGVSQLVRQIIQPKLLGDSVGMPAIPTLFLLYVGFRVGGAIGLIVAVPIGMIVHNLYIAGVFSNFFYSTRILLKDLKKIRVFTEDELKAEGISVTMTGVGSDEEVAEND